MLINLGRVLSLFALGLVFAIPGAFAADTDWRLRLYGFYMATGESPSFVDAAGMTLASDNDYGAGLGIAAEYRLSRRLGLELGVAVADHGDFRGTAAQSGTRLDASDTMTVTSITVALDVHLTPESNADVHIGPLLARFDYGDLALRYDSSTPPPESTSSNVVLNLGDDLAWGLNLGLDLALGDTDWLLYATLRYVKTSLDAAVAGGAKQAVDYDPLILGVGFGYRF